MSLLTRPTSNASGTYRSGSKGLTPYTGISLQLRQTVASGASGLRSWTPNATTSELLYSPDQLAFLERKRRYLAGEGPAMPVETVCPTCNGSGLVCCHACRGTGVNDKTMHEALGNNGEAEIRQTNGLVNVEWKFIKGGPCWLCMGKPQEVGCKECQGTGIKGFKMENYSGD